jgi:hypothetical protein
VHLYLERFKLRDSAGKGDLVPSSFGDLDETMSDLSDSAADPEFRMANASVAGLFVDYEGSRKF